MKRTIRKGTVSVAVTFTVSCRHGSGGIGDNSAEKLRLIMKIGMRV